MSVARHPAMLLLGPTGSGKTPLGQAIEALGLPGMKCVHFDFGERLREVAARRAADEMLSPADIEVVRGVLASGALLEDEQFPLAQRILRSFLARRGVDSQTCVVLNGLPRHVGQARAMDAILDIRVVICLECSGDTVLHRLASNVGGDRAGRPDDCLDRVQKRLDIFQQRTAPLVDHYRRLGVPIKTLQITSTTTAADAWRMLAAAL
jgi:adenylate kinase